MARSASRSRHRLRIGAAPVLLYIEALRLQIAADPESSVTYLTKKHLSRRTVLRGLGVAVGLPLLDAMIPAGDGAREHRGRAEAARRILLYSARRDLVEHGVRQGDGPLVPERRRRRFQAEPDPLAAREVQELRDLVLEPREQGEPELGARDRARDLAQRRTARPCGDRRQHGDDDRPDHRGQDRPGDGAALARSRVRDDDASRRVPVGRRLLLQHDAVVP